MKSWNEFDSEEPELAKSGRKMLFTTRAHIGQAFLATLRKDGAPRLHPVALVFLNNHLYVFISPTSPKCADLNRDGRYALQAFPPPENERMVMSSIFPVLLNVFKINRYALPSSLKREFAWMRVKCFSNSS